MDIDRRHVLAGAGASAIGGAAVLASPLQAQASSGPGRRPRPMPKAPDVPAARLARDERFWARVRAEYDLPRDYVNYENGYFGTTPRRVVEEYKHHIDVLARDSSYFMRTAYPAKEQAARERVARLLGVSVEEIALTRGATEALQNLIGGYNKLRPGDQVLYVDLDYDSMQYAMDWLKDRRGVTVVKGVIPEPATHASVLAYYESFLKVNPRARLLLLTHLSHRTGLVMPVREIVAMAAARGVDVIVDAAHSWGQIPFTAKDLGAAFVGYNLHKWISAPLGIGFMYIRKDRLADIDRDHGDQDYPATDIRSRVHTGTSNSANLLSLQVALDLHESIGVANKHARLQYLRDRWVRQVRDVPRLQILTPDDPRMYSALTSFRVQGRVTKADTTAMTAWLMERHHIFTVRRGGVARGEVVRVTPGLYSSASDSDRMARALAEITRVF